MFNLVLNLGAVLHSHAYSANLITSLFEGKNEFRISHQEMIKGITGYGYYDELVVPIIENTAWEHELADKLGETIAKYPKAVAVLVRRHGMYVWGNNWEQAKRHGECLHYLFEVTINMKKLGLDYTKPPLIYDALKDGSSLPLNKRNKIELQKYKHVIFDIEGTTTPITFVKDILFPYASNEVYSYLLLTWGSTETQKDVDNLIIQNNIDINEKINSPVIINDQGKDILIESVVKYVQWNITQDRKVTALKTLQGHIWKLGYESSKLQSLVYPDVKEYFERLYAQDIQISIYSSGSREAQYLLFKYSNQGDLTKYISVYFDTKIGNKREISSYNEISLSLGIETNKKHEILFITDIYEEAVAAKQSGYDVILSVREGNTTLPEQHEFQIVTNFDSL